MKVLIAENDDRERRLLETMVRCAGHEIVVCSRGDEAWWALKGRQAPRFVILDWNVPGLSGIDICRLLRDRGDDDPAYVILVTGRARTEQVVFGLAAGADDCMTKPFRRIELEARLRVGARMIALRTELAGCLADTEAVNVQLRALQSSAAKRTPTTCPDCRRAFPSPVAHRWASGSS